MALISVAELQALIDQARLDNDDTDLIIFDLRFCLSDLDQGRRWYDAGHLPGAYFVDLHNQLADTSIENAGRHPLPPIESFAALLGHFGVRPSSVVVVYDDVGGAYASRLWWMLRSVGHDQVAVLDGGFQGWVAGGGAVVTDQPHRAASQYPVPADWSGVVTAAEIIDGLQSDIKLIDSRAPQRYRGEHEPIDAAAGHIPTALNIFHENTLTAAGTHRPVTELVELFCDVGDRPVVYCGSGVTACHNLLALAVAQVPGARLYPGSWSEWSAAARPVAVGDDAGCFPT